VIALVASMLAATCAPTDDDAGLDDGPQPIWPLPRSCPPPPDLASPTTIEEVVTLINALPKPTSLPCVLESLERPFGFYASSSTAGAQPATGTRSPRIFLFREELTMSVVPEGTGSNTLELSYAIGERMSIKAELPFPVEQMLDPAAPYDQVDLGSGTSCGLCHGEETRVMEIDFATAWASDVYQDDTSQSVSLSFVRQNALDCDHEAEPERCGMLDAIFGHGDLVAQDLPRDSKICRPL